MPMMSTHVQKGMTTQTVSFAYSYYVNETLTSGLLITRSIDGNRKFWVGVEQVGFWDRISEGSFVNNVYVRQNRG